MHSRHLLCLVLPLLLFGRIARSEDHSALKSIIQGLAAERESYDIQAAWVVQDANTGEVLYARDPEALLNPASNAKVLTTLAALSFLGPDFRFKTQLIGDGDFKAGSLTTLTLKGFGDPSFSTERLEEMVRDLRAKGVKSVQRVQVDQTYFDLGEYPGWSEDFRRGEARFVDKVGALILDQNQMEVVVTPGDSVGDPAQVNLNPPLTAFFCDGEILTRGRKSQVSIHNNGGGFEGLRLAVAGTIPAGAAPQSYRVACENPGQLAGMRLVDMLQQHGIEAPRQFSLAAAPAKGKVLVEEKSTTLSEVLTVINKKSDNFLAEQLAKVLGAEYAGAPGTTAKGMRAIFRELHATGVDTKGIYMENGSGLSRNTRIKVNTLVGALQQVYDNPRLGRDFIASLSVLGVDGTLRRRFRNTDLAGRFFGKTGTLRAVTSLSGYAFPSSGQGEKAFIFSYIINGSGKEFWQQKQLMQEVLELLLQQ